MKRWFDNLRARMQQWMSGRYGFDELSRTLMYAGVILMLVSFVPALSFLSFPALVLVLWSSIRSYSKKIERRQAERAAYLRFTGKIRSWFQLRKKIFQERKTHRYIRCKQCKTMMRVPKGRGTIRISCPKCHSETIKKT